MNAAQAIMRQRKIKWYEHSKKKDAAPQKTAKACEDSHCFEFGDNFHPKDL